MLADRLACTVLMLAPGDAPMTTGPWTIWCNLGCDPPARALLEAGVGAHRLQWAEACTPTNTPLGAPDRHLAEADIAFGQPEADQCKGLTGWPGCTSPRPGTPPSTRGPCGRRWPRARAG